MNQIVSLNTASTLTMSSREIAKLTGKRHDNVMRDATNMLVELYDVRDTLKFEDNYLDSGNRKQTQLLLPKRETFILVSGYSVELRARIIDRWMELEEQQAKTQVVPITTTEVSKRFFAAIHPPVNSLLVQISKSAQWVKCGEGGNLFPCG